MAGLFTFEKLLGAHRRCLRGKRGARGALLFESRVEENILRLLAELESGTYRPSPSFCFVTGRPKAREILAAPYRDRVAHHLVVGALEPYWEHRFIADSFACRKGRGTLAGARRLQQLMRQAGTNRSRRAYFLKLDIRSYFASIDRTLLLERLREGLRRESPPWRVEAEALLEVLANVYLDPLDQFVKRELRALGYVRYVDDFVLLGRSEAELERHEEEIRTFLADRLRLRLHPTARRLGTAQRRLRLSGVHRASHPPHGAQARGEERDRRPRLRCRSALRP